MCRRLLTGAASAASRHRGARQGGQGLFIPCPGAPCTQEQRVHVNKSSCWLESEDALCWQACTHLRPTLHCSISSKCQSWLHAGRRVGRACVACKRQRQPVPLPVQDASAPGLQASPSLHVQHPLRRPAPQRPLPEDGAAVLHQHSNAQVEVQAGRPRPQRLPQPQHLPSVSGRQGEEACVTPPGCCWQAAPAGGRSCAVVHDQGPASRLKMEGCKVYMAWRSNTHVACRKIPA